MKSDIHKPNYRSRAPTKSLNFPTTLGKGVSGVSKDTTDKEAKHNCPTDMHFDDKKGRCVQDEKKGLRTHHS